MNDHYRQSEDEDKMKNVLIISNGPKHSFL